METSRAPPIKLGASERQAWFHDQFIRFTGILGFPQDDSWLVASRCSRCSRTACGVSGRVSKESWPQTTVSDSYVGCQRCGWVCVQRGGPRLPCGFPLKPEKRSPNKHVTHTNERANHLARVLPRLFPHVIVNPEIGTWDPEPLSIFIEAAKVPESQRHLARHKASISRN